MAYTNSNQIGEITEVTGVAKIIRTDGTEEQITLGTEVFQGDIVETTDGGAVNIGFVDDSSFAVSNDARISIDEFVFDPETEGGVQDFSVMKGVFMYTSGLIGRENPDQVEIDTPVGSIGIRGTIIGGHINPEGDSSVSVLEGAIVVRNDGGEQLLTNQYETVTLTSRDVAPSGVEQLDASHIANNFEAVKDVSPSLFSSLSDQIQQEQKAETVSDNLNSSEDVKEEPLEDEMKAEDDGEEKNVAEEQLLEEQQPESEALEDTIEKIETLDVKPELKTIEINMSDRQGAKHNDNRINKPTKSESQRSEEQTTLSENTGPQPPAQNISFISGGNIDENSTSGMVVGTVTLSNAANVTYSLIGPNSVDFSLDSASGLLTYNGSDSGNFEAGDILNVGIRAIDENGRTTEQGLQITLNDVNESPDVKLALEDVYSVGDLNDASDDKGIITRDVYGARIAKLAIHDPEGDSFSAGDFSLLGNVGGQPAGDYFQVVEDNGDFYLELKPGFKIDSSNNMITDGTNSSSTIGTEFNLALNLGEANNSISIKIGDVESVTGTVLNNIDVNTNIVIGDDNNNNFSLSDDSFIFINGGDGFDKLYLDDSATTLEYNLSGSVTYKDELSSIENILFSNANDTLKIDINNIIRLLKTSNQNNELLISTNSTGAGSNGINIVDNSMNPTNLTDHGFVDMGTEDRGGESYEIFHHAQHGTVAIETNIAGADSGGL